MRRRENGPTRLEDLRKDEVLHLRVVHTYGASADFDTIQDKIIVLSTNLQDDENQ